MAPSFAFARIFCQISSTVFTAVFTAVFATVFATRNPDWERILSRHRRETQAETFPTGARIERRVHRMQLHSNNGVVFHPLAFHWFVKELARSREGAAAMENGCW